MSLTPYDTVGSSCAICLEDMIPFQSVLITGLCGHTFHKNCADQVQTNVDRCAKCRHVFDIELPSDCIDDNEYDSCVTIYNTRALEYLSSSTITSIKFVYAGVIPASISKFANLEQVYVYESNSDDDFEDVDDSFELTPCSLISVYDNCKSLKFLKCVGTYMPIVSADIGGLSNLIYLSLVDCDIRVLPETIFGLTSLKSLNLSHNLIAELPLSFGKLTQLIQLDVSHNSLRTFPSTCNKMWLDLDTVTLCNNMFVELPDFLQYARNLRVINCRNTLMTSLPSWIDDLRYLLTLNLSKNDGLATLVLQKLVPWTTLDISSTGVTNFKFLAHTPLLAELSISGLKLKRLPDELQGLCHLTRLNSNRNRLTSIPQTITTKLKSSLRILDVSRNRFRGSLPSGLFPLTRLEHLNLSYNSLDSVAIGSSETHMLKKLVTLDLSNNYIQIVGREIKNFRRLALFRLDDNYDLVSIHPAILSLKQLRVVFVTGCDMWDFPATFAYHDKIRFVSE